MDKYLNLIKKNNIETYFVRETVDKSVELFFIKKKLDMQRMKETDTAVITVYKDMEEDGKKLRGASECIVAKAMSDEEIDEKIKSAAFAAKFVKNPFFELPKPVKSDKVVAESDLNNLSLKDIATKFVDALYAVDTDKEAFINSFELFVKEEDVHMVSSTGADVAYVKRTVKGEFVAQCKAPQDVETYQNFEYDSMALSELQDLVKTTLQMTKDRAKATKMPKAGNYDIVLSDKYLNTVMDFYGERAHAAYVYAGYSNFKVGQNVQGENIKGDKLNMKFVPSVPFNEEAIPMKERDFIADGVLKTIHGPQRFSYYMGIEPIGTYSKAKVPAGKVSFEELKNRKCLYVVNFSDFQMNAMSGYFAGEIRLAYLYDGKGNVECVTGGSINGNFLEAEKDLTFSTEMTKTANYEGPKACLFKNIPVAGEK